MMWMRCSRWLVIYFFFGLVVYCDVFLSLCLFVCLFCFVCLICCSYFGECIRGFALFSLLITLHLNKEDPWGGQRNERHLCFLLLLVRECSHSDAKLSLPPSFSTNTFPSMAFPPCPVAVDVVSHVLWSIGHQPPRKVSWASESEYTLNAFMLTLTPLPSPCGVIFFFLLCRASKTNYFKIQTPSSRVSWGSSVCP